MPTRCYEICLDNYRHMLIGCSGGKYARDIYKYLMMALDKCIQHSRYDMPRSALQLLAKHACQWDQCIIDDYEVIVCIAPIP